MRSSCECANLKKKQRKRRKPKCKITLRQKRLRMLRALRNGDDSSLIYFYHGYSIGLRLQPKNLGTYYKATGVWRTATIFRRYGTKTMSFNQLHDRFHIRRLEMFPCLQDALISITAKVHGNAHAIILKMKLSA